MTDQKHTADPFDDEPTASELRAAFQERIGATPDRDKALWSALDRVIVAYGNEHDRVADEAGDALICHFPHLEAAMRVVWHEHMAGMALRCDGRDCEPDA